MKTTTLPLISGVALAAMFAAGLSHWWSVREFIAAIDSGVTVSPASRPAALATAESIEASEPKSAARPDAMPDAKSAAIAEAEPAATDAAGKQRFYESLISRMESLQTQNRDLLDQLAETNRDLMKLEFRVDTHSESFRPLPVTEDQPFTSLEQELGVLPPRAQAVPMPDYE